MSIFIIRLMNRYRLQIRLLQFNLKDKIRVFTLRTGIL